MIHVCPLSRVAETVVAARAQRLISLLSAGAEVRRPAGIAEADHLWLRLHDIVEAQEGMTLPSAAHVSELIEFARRWNRERPLVIHCYAGISRSTASAYIAAAALAPDRDETELARALRAASPSATPNSLMISLADGILGRGGRMIEAVRSIGRGVDATEAVPFSLRVQS